MIRRFYSEASLSRFYWRVVHCSAALCLITAVGPISAAETKAPAQKSENSGEAVIEAELRKALLGKSSLTGELLMKTGADVKPAPATAKTSEPSGSKPVVKAPKPETKGEPRADGKGGATEAKDPAASDAALGKKLPMPVPSAAANPSTAMPAPSALAATTHSAPHAPGHGSVHWGYMGAHGPEAWGKLAPEFATCAKGKRQSPVDLVDRELTGLNLDPLQFEYGPSPFRLEHNGHTVEVRLPAEQALVTRGKRYPLVQFHFHSPAEEKINGKSFALDAHFVHRSEDGELAVVALLFEEGASNPQLQRLWDNMPLDAGDRVLSVEGSTFNPISLLPADRRAYVQFIGSLTTPPCTEGVVWTVLRQVVTASPEQIAVFRKLIGTNARPVQPLNGRLLKASN